MEMCWISTFVAFRQSHVISLNSLKSRYFAKQSLVILVYKRIMSSQLHLISLWCCNTIWLGKCFISVEAFLKTFSKSLNRHQYNKVVIAFLHTSSHVSNRSFWCCIVLSHKQVYHFSIRHSRPQSKTPYT